MSWRYPLRRACKPELAATSVPGLSGPRGDRGRHLNEGFSEGPKKRNEILQMAVLEPNLAIPDETDSGLDTDALAAVGREFRRCVQLGRALR